MVLSTPFTCPNGHSFQANAKLRTRCPECGAMARRSFESKKEEPTKELEAPSSTPEPKETPEPKPAVKVLRRGRPSSIPEKSTKKMTKKPAITVAAKKKGLVSHKAIKKAVVPIVRGKPKGNREHKVAAAVGEDRPYWHKVADEYGIF